MYGHISIHRAGSTSRAWCLKTTKRALRVLRHQERHARAAGERHSRSPSPLPAGRGVGIDTQSSLVRPGVLVEPTETPAKGVYLISHPLSFLYAPEEMFHRSVVLLVDHSPMGSYGLVVNKDKGETLEEALCEDALPLASDALQQVLKNPVRVGGPVMSRLAWLHPHKDVGGVPLAEGAEKPVRTFSREDMHSSSFSKLWRTVLAVGVCNQSSDRCWPRPDSFSVFVVSHSEMIELVGCFGEIGRNCN